VVPRGADDREGGLGKPDFRRLDGPSRRQGGDLVEAAVFNRVDVIQGVDQGDIFPGSGEGGDEFDLFLDYLYDSLDPALGRSRVTGVDVVKMTFMFCCWLLLSFRT